MHRRTSLPSFKPRANSVCCLGWLQVSDWCRVTSASSLTHSCLLGEELDALDDLTLASFLEERVTAMSHEELDARLRRAESHLFSTRTYTKFVRAIVGGFDQMRMAEVRSHNAPAPTFGKCISNENALQGSLMQGEGLGRLLRAL